MTKGGAVLSSDGPTPADECRREWKSAAIRSEPACCVVTDAICKVRLASLRRTLLLSRRLERGGVLRIRIYLLLELCRHCGYNPIFE
jgi:hypothetical protein